MNANAEFLNYVYQNSQMGVDTLEQLLDITEDEKLQAYLKKQLEGYCKFHSEARDLLNRNGYDEKGLGTFEINPHLPDGESSDHGRRIHLPHRQNADPGQQHGNHRSREKTSSV